MLRGRQGPTISRQDSRHGLITLCFVQVVLSTTLLLLLTTQWTPEHRLFHLSQHIFLISWLTRGTLLAIPITSIAIVVSVWVRIPRLMLVATGIISLLLVMLVLTIVWITQLHNGIWNNVFALNYMTNGDDVCPGIAGSACCGWDYCPLPLCEFADRPCEEVVTQWIRDLFVKTMPLLSLILTLGVAQTVLGFYRVQLLWRQGVFA
ncbi:putative membrane-associated protein [Trypanosoma theileri]|uniref:Putative membrane-associated protein n=1 Tax=Trypanosoma theileri TaxID=67003 RepID=A0A1X0P3S7_9TRYP|nr:putative membrane-associated protein [Trypanosoma theileri]ORC91535.1 putative membrane-associated protein [Trypanosoma theileri]